MKFKTEWLKALQDEEHEEAEVVEEKMIETTRWAILYSFIFKFAGKYYATSYRIGATENQDERPWEFDEDEIECREVKPVQKTITVYK